MKLIIAGSRTIKEPAFMNWAFLKFPFINPIEEVVSGCARGADTLGEWWAKSRGYKIKRFPAAWGIHGKKAGPIRNRQMAEYADVLIALLDGASRCTGNMINIMKELNKPVFVYNISDFYNEVSNG